MTAAPPSLRTRLVQLHEVLHGMNQDSSGTLWCMQMTIKLPSLRTIQVKLCCKPNTVHRMLHDMDQGSSGNTLMPADDSQAFIIEDKTGQAVLRTKAMGNLWVELSASGSTAHGPALRIRLVSDHHPQLRSRQSASVARTNPSVASASHRHSRRSESMAEAGMQKGSMARHAMPAGSNDSSGRGVTPAQHDSHAVPAGSNDSHAMPAGSNDNHAMPAGSNNGSGGGMIPVQHDSVLQGGVLQGTAKDAAELAGDQQRTGLPKDSRQRHQKHRKAEHTSIASVLAATFFCDEGEAGVEERHLKLGDVHADVQQDLMHAEAPGKQQLLGCDMLPSPTLGHFPDVGYGCSLWQAQLRLGKLAARVNASLTSSERMSRLQTKLQASCLQIAQLQQP